MIRVIEVVGRRVARHRRRVLACDRCARKCFTTIWETYVDGRRYDLCEPCANHLDGETGVDVVRARTLRDRLTHPTRTRHDRRGSVGAA